MNLQIKDIEREIFELTAKLNELRGQSQGVEVKNYGFETLNGPTTLLDLFAGLDAAIQVLDTAPADGRWRTEPDRIK